MTTLAQTWIILSFSNLIPTSHTSDVTLDRAKLIYGIIMKMDMNLGYLISHQISLIAQHDTSRLGFPALITTLCKARGVQSDSRSLQNLSPAINLAYIKKNCRNLDDPTMTFRGPSKARCKRSEVPTTQHHQRQQLILLPQLQYLPFRLQLFLQHLHRYHFQLLYLQDFQTLYLHHRCFIPCSRAYTGGSPSSCRAFRAWACHPS